MTTVKQDNEFMEQVISNSLLEDSIAWIAANLNPEDVFPDDELETWATEYGMVQEET